MSNTQRRFSIFVFVAISVAMLFGIFNYLFSFCIDNNKWDTISATTTLSGDGTEENPYIIASADDLFLLANGIDTTENNAFNNKYYKQTQDIDLTNLTFNGIGSNLSASTTINYDGMGHIIKQVQNGTSSHFSFFGNIKNSCIKNLHIEHLGVNVNITENNVSKNIGVFADYVKDSKITNCSLDTIILNLQTSSLTNVNVGGFVGLAQNSTLIDCFCRDVKLFTEIECDSFNYGLFVGKAEDSQISTCFADGRLTQNGDVQNANIGGFVGNNNSQISNCYSTLTNGFEIADITSLQSASIGGFIGVTNGVADITNCYAVATFFNQDYSSKKVGLFAGTLTNNAGTFTNCYVADIANMFIDASASNIYDASNLLTTYTKLNSNYYELSSYFGFSNLIWKDNQSNYSYPQLLGIGNDLGDEFVAKLTDADGVAKGYYESLEDCFDGAVANDDIYILKNQVSVGSLEIDKNVNLKSSFDVEYSLLQNTTGYAFVLSAGCTFTIDGNINFQGLSNNNVGFASGSGTDTLILKHTSICGFACTTLIDNLTVNLFDVTIQNNTVQNLINAQSVNLKKSTILQNKDGSNNKSAISIVNKIEIDGYDNLLDISLAFAIDNLGAKIQRTGLTDSSNSVNSNIDISITNNESEWTINSVLVQANKNLIYDNITYNLLNSPKFAQTNIQKYILKSQDNQLLLRGQIFDIEYFDNQAGEYQRYYGKDMYNNNLPQYFEYGVNVSLNNLRNDNMQFVGWFGYDTETNRYFNKNQYLSSNIFSSSFSTSTAINTVDASFNLLISYYDLPKQTGVVQTFGKFVFDSKWQYDFVIEMQEEANVGGEIQYTASFDAGVLCIDDSVYTTNVSNTVSKQVDAGSNIKLTATVNQNYTFAGWWQEINGVFVKYNKYQYTYNSNSNTYVLNIAVADSLVSKLYARYIKNAYIVNLQKILKDEHNISLPVQILENELILRTGEKVTLQIDRGNYHLDLSPEKRVQSKAIQNNQFPKYEFNDETFTLTIENNVGSGYGDLTIYLEKNYKIIILKYGENQDSNNFDGGDCEISETYTSGVSTIYSTFNHTTNQTMNYGQLKTISKTANIYFSTSAVIYINTKDGYRFDSSNTYIIDANGQRVDYVITKENGVTKAITVQDVINDIQVFIHFQKTYSLEFSLSAVSIDGVQTKIGEIQFENDDWTQTDKIKIVDKGSSVDFRTRQISGLGPYQFVKWIITSGGEPVELENIGLTESDLYQQDLVLRNINQNLEFKAFYNNANIKVSIIWNGKNARVSNVGAKALGNDSYEIEYGQDISLVISPKSKKYIIKTLKCENAQIVCERVDNQDGTISFVAKNLLSNTRVLLDVVADSWLEHLEETELFGDGTKENPYLISTPSELQLIAKFVNEKVQAPAGKTNYDVAYYKLTNSIDLGEDYYFVSIGTASSPFNGTFDYNYFAIKNIYTEPDAYIINNALFYIMGKEGKVINKYRSNLPIIIGVVSIIVTVLISSIIVLIIEKRRKRPRKVIILNGGVRKDI